MSKLQKPLPLRQSDDGKWEVKNLSGKWIKCETKADARVLSDASILEALWLETRPLNKVLAARLENTAEKMEWFNMRTDASRFRRWAKLARGKSS